MSQVKAALIVANDRYDDPRLSRLGAPHEDAQALSGVLRDPAIGGFDVQFSLNRREHELRRLLSRFFAERGPDDVLLVHFSCHGVKDDEGQLYFAAPDTELEHLDATAVPAALVSRLMHQSNAQRIVLLLDCCYGGAFARGMRARGSRTVDLGEAGLHGKGRIVLTASRAMEFAWEGDKLHGTGHPAVFTAAVVEGLRTGDADLDGDQRISVHELYEYVFARVRAERARQTPQKLGSEEGSLIIARSRTAKASALPPEVREAMSSGLPEVREAAVATLGGLLHSEHPGRAPAAREALERLRRDRSARVATAAAAALRGPQPATEPQRRSRLRLALLAAAMLAAAAVGFVLLTRDGDGERTQPSRQQAAAIATAEAEVAGSTFGPTVPLRAVDGDGTAGSAFLFTNDGAEHVAVDPGTTKGRRRVYLFDTELSESYSPTLLRDSDDVDEENYLRGDADLAVFRLPEDYRDHRRIGLATVARDGSPRLSSAARMAELGTPNGQGTDNQLSLLSGYYKEKAMDAIATLR
jgi:hypothetical protein